MEENKKYKDLSLEEVIEIGGREVELITADSKERLRRIMEEGIRERKDKYIIVHYQMSHTRRTAEGHWAGMIIKQKIREIYYFDSYGYFPDDQLEMIPIEYRKRTNQVYRDIGKFLYEAIKERGYRVRYNDKKMQASDKRIATCGRYVGLFIKMGKSPEEYGEILGRIKEIAGIISYDELITKLT